LIAARASIRAQAGSHRPIAAAASRATSSVAAANSSFAPPKEAAVLRRYPQRAFQLRTTCRAQKKIKATTARVWTPSHPLLFNPSIDQPDQEARLPSGRK